MVACWLGWLLPQCRGRWRKASSPRIYRIYVKLDRGFFFLRGIIMGAFPHRAEGGRQAALGKGVAVSRRGAVPAWSVRAAADGRILLSRCWWTGWGGGAWPGAGDMKSASQLLDSQSGFRCVVTSNLTRSLLWHTAHYTARCDAGSAHHFHVSTVPAANTHTARPRARSRDPARVFQLLTQACEHVL